jgi:hypothetical protein
MKTKLLRKAKRYVSMAERNGVFYVFVGNDQMQCTKLINNALICYRYWILKRAKAMFGFKPKKRLR